MNALEESASPVLVCHFLLILGGMCFAGFSFVTVKHFLSAIRRVNFDQCLKLSSDIIEEFGKNFRELIGTANFL
jgi:hypothetical protein